MAILTSHKSKPWERHEHAKVQQLCGRVAPHLNGPAEQSPDAVRPTTQVEVQIDAETVKPQEEAEE